jgi:hypothetical protein
MEVDFEVKEIEETIDIFSRQDPDRAEMFRRGVIRDYMERLYRYFTSY